MGINHLIQITEVTAVERVWLPRLAPQYCQFSAPLKEPAPRYQAEVSHLDFSFIH